MSPPNCGIFESSVVIGWVWLPPAMRFCVSLTWFLAGFLSFFGILVLYANFLAVAGGYILDVGYLCYAMVELDAQMFKLVRCLISSSSFLFL